MNSVAVTATTGFVSSLRPVANLLYDRRHESRSLSSWNLDCIGHFDSDGHLRGALPVARSDWVSTGSTTFRAGHAMSVPADLGCIGRQHWDPSSRIRLRKWLASRHLRRRLFHQLQRGTCTGRGCGLQSDSAAKSVEREGSSGQEPEALGDSGGSGLLDVECLGHPVGEVLAACVDVESAGSGGSER